MWEFSDSPYRTKINAAIVYLKETGKLQSLKKTWWEDKQNGSRCLEQEGPKSAESLDISHIGGVFIILVLGLGAAFVVACAERMAKNQPG